MHTHHHDRAYLWRSPSSFNRRLRFRHYVLKYREYLISLVNFLHYRDID